MPQNLEHSGTSWKGQKLKHDDSIIDTFAPRVRIIWAIVFALIVVLSNAFSVALTALGCACVLVFFAKLNIKRTFRRVLAMDIFMVFLIVMLPFTTPITEPDDLLFEVLGLTASFSGFLQALLISIKANAVVLSLLAVVGTMSATKFGHALAKLRVPDKLVHLLLFTVRYLDVIGQEYKRMRRAMQARAFVLRMDTHTWRSIGYLVGMLLIHALERSERILEAMKCRGYSGRFHLLDEERLVARDYYLVILCVPFFVSLMLLNFI